MDILPIFCDIDDFCQFFEALWKKRLLSEGERRRDRAGYLCLSEVMTIIVMFHSSAYRNFKAYYTEQVLKHYASAFPRLTSYQRFVELMPQTLVPLCAYLQT
ncbi:MAG TPA: IS982 family transposase, partial [Pyrinomonadaceae bacterium]|nr:IS982 family transposase [Pyrinomonadaceae bacterium]